MRLFIIFFLFLFFIPCVQAGLQEDILLEKEKLEQGISSGELEGVLPLSLEIEVEDNGEVVFVEIGKSGEISFFGDGSDMRINGSSEDLKNLLFEEGDVEEKLENVDIEPRSTKARVGVSVIEEAFGLEISHSERFMDKVVKFFVRVGMWIAGLF